MKSFASKEILLVTVLLALVVSVAIGKAAPNGSGHHEEDYHGETELDKGEEKAVDVSEKVSAGVKTGGSSADAKAGELDLGPIKGFQNILSPIELCKSIAKFFKLDLEKFLDAIGRGLVFGVEAVLQPGVVSLKIIEKVFVPNPCGLKFVCKIGNHLSIFKRPVEKFSSNFLESSSHIDAFTKGILGCDCDSLYPTCGKDGAAQLKPQFKALKHDEEH